MVKLWYAYYLVMQFLVTCIAVYNVLVVSGPTIEKKVLSTISCYL